MRRSWGALDSCLTYRPLWCGRSQRYLSGTVSLYNPHFCCTMHHVSSVRVIMSPYGPNIMHMTSNASLGDICATWTSVVSNDRLFNSQSFFRLNKQEHIADSQNCACVSSLAIIRGPPLIWWWWWWRRVWYVISRLSLCNPGAET
jgi:hypothetical protein